MTYSEYTVHTLEGKKVSDIKLEQQYSITEQLRKSGLAAGAYLLRTIDAAGQSHLITVR